MLGARDLRAFCRPPMGVAVAFAGVSTYDDGTSICGLFDAPIQIKLAYDGMGGIGSQLPELRLPFNAFDPMPASGDSVTVTDEGTATTWTVDQPTAEDDGAFLVYGLLSRDSTVNLQASGATQSVQSRVLDAVVAALGGNDANAWRCRFRAFGPKELPAENVLPEPVAGEYSTAGQIERRLRFHVRHMVAGFDGAGSVQLDTAEKAADARYVRGAKLILADPTLGGLVRSVREADLKFEFEQSDQQIVVLVATYEAEFSTSLRDPSVAGL